MARAQGLPAVREAALVVLAAAIEALPYHLLHTRRAQVRRLHPCRHSGSMEALGGGSGLGHRIFCKRCASGVRVCRVPVGVPHHVGMSGARCAVREESAGCCRERPHALCSCLALQVVKVVTAALDDERRGVRLAAARCRRLWVRPAT